MARLFGTDGVRGVANADLTPELALGIAAAAAHVLAGDPVVGRRRQAVLGRDPRASGEMLSAAVVAGLTSAGVDVLDVGVLPTPATAYLTKALDADFGVMLSASHNPMPDNGVKLFARGGVKLADHLEDAIEARLGQQWDRPVGEDVGRVHDVGDAARERYVAHLCSTIDVPLDGLRVVLDCAHGAASWVGPEVLTRAGAEVVTFAAEPDGVNINDHVGSTHLDGLVEVVRSTGVDAGFALDGDADRCLAVDAAGELVDGDQIMAVLAVALHERGELTHDTVVATVMSNLGFRIAMDSAGIKVVETGVGDRYVLEAMRDGGFALGGEQSGHVILDAHATTGDGVLTALQVLARMATTRATLADLAGVVHRLPQVLVNVSGVDRSRVDTSAELAEAVAAASAELGATGRVLLRPSGTEPLVRVMVEAATADVAGAVADRLAAAVRSALG